MAIEDADDLRVDENRVRDEDRTAVHRDDTLCQCSLAVTRFAEEENGLPAVQSLADLIQHALSEDQWPESFLDHPRCHREVTETLRGDDLSILLDRNRCWADVSAACQELLSSLVTFARQGIAVAQFADPVASGDLDEFLALRLTQGPFQEASERQTQCFDEFTSDLGTMGVEELEGEFEDELQIQPCLLQARRLG